MASCSSLLTNYKPQIWFIKHRRRPIAITTTKGKGIMDYKSIAYAYVRGKKWEQQNTSPDFLPLAGRNSHLYVAELSKQLKRIINQMEVRQLEKAGGKQCVNVTSATNFPYFDHYFWRVNVDWSLISSVFLLIS